MRRPASILALAFVTGCSLFTSLDGLSNGPLVGEEGGSGDASETGTPLPPPSSDGGDGGPSIDASFCDRISPTPKICVDFTDGRITRNPGGSRDFEGNIGPLPALDNAVFGDRPPAARFDVPASSGEAFLKRTINLAGLNLNHLLYGMSFRFDTSAAVNINLMELRRGNIDESLFFTVDGTSMALVAYAGGDGGTVSATIPGAFTTGQWHRMEWLFDVAGGMVVITLDGATVLSGPVDFLASTSASTLLTFVAGTTDSDQSGTLWIDDVVIDY